MSNTLKKDFDLRKSFFTNRASAIFPIHFSNFDNDLILSWLNYWSIKNNISSNNITVNLRIYNSYGNLYLRTGLTLKSDNNYVSIRDFVDEKFFYGMAEIELISTSNIGFTFPAIIGFYKSGDLYSCVHSSGRIKGSDENHSIIKIEETNWSCKFGNNITPFFHYVNGCRDEQVSLNVNLYYYDGTLANSSNIKDNFKSFGSKIYFIDEIFDGYNFKDGMFVGVVCNNDSVFRRMVVGNFHKKLNHLEVTHSFSKQDSIDYCPENKNGFESFLAMYNDQRLSLKCRVFPTNCSYDFNVSKSNELYSDKSLSKNFSTEDLKKGYGTINLEDDVKTSVIWFDGKRVPSRLNTNFIYKIKNDMSCFSTDIATGAKSSVYPPKHSHWGSGIFGNGYEFVILIRNINHEMNTKNSKGKLSVFGLDKTYEFEVEIRGDSSYSINLTDFLKENIQNVDLSKEHFLSWYMKLDGSNSETFWLSFREEDGCILGEHGF